MKNRNTILNKNVEFLFQLCVYGLTKNNLMFYPKKEILIISHVDIWEREREKEREIPASKFKLIFFYIILQHFTHNIIQYFIQCFE